MKLKIEIDMTGTAFSPTWNSGSESARILKNLAASLSGRDLNRNEDSFTLRDRYDNVVGEAVVK